MSSLWNLQFAGRTRTQRTRVSLEPQSPMGEGCQFSDSCFEVGQSYPEAPHEPFTEPPVLDHVGKDSPELLVGGRAVLPLHAHFEHLD